MEGGDKRFVGPFSILKRKSLRKGKEENSRRLRNILGEMDSLDDDDRESVDSRCSSGVSSSQASNDIAGFVTETSVADRSHAGRVSDAPGIEKLYENINKSDEHSAEIVEDIEFRQKTGEGIVREECRRMHDLTKRIDNMNDTMKKNKKAADLRFQADEGLDSAEKIIGNSEFAYFQSTIGICPASDSAREERRPGDDIKLVRRKHNLFYHEAEERESNSQIDWPLVLSNPNSIDSSAVMSHDHNGNGPVDRTQSDGLLTRFGERHSTGTAKKRPTTSIGLDFERKMGSPMSSRSSSVRSHSSSVPASIDSGLRMGFLEPHTSIVVVAIDFGTTFSGYAFAFTRDPDSIHMMRKWEGGDPGVNNQKIPTTLLLRPDGSFHSFGYGARDFYHDLEHSEAKKWLFFEKFKMSLHSSEVRK